MKVYLHAVYVHLLISGLVTRLFAYVSLLLLLWMHLWLKICSLKTKTLLENLTYNHRTILVGKDPEDHKVQLLT